MTFQKLKEDCVDEASRLSNEVENSKGKYANSKHSEGFEKLFKVAAARLELFHAMGCSAMTWARSRQANTPRSLLQILVT